MTATVTDDAVYAALVDAVASRDDVTGDGVPLEDIVERLPVGESSTRRRLENLRSEGRVRKGWGVPPGDRPRQTYRPCRTED